MLQPHNGYTDRRKWYENEWDSVEYDHKGLSLFTVESQIEGYIREQEACHIENVKK